VPLACASIGQVHRARLLSGEEVVVKVQRRGIDKKMRIDTGRSWRAWPSWPSACRLKDYRPSRPLPTSARTLLRELDFVRERRNMERFEKVFRRDPSVLVPRTYGELCTARVLTMQRLEGIALSDCRRLNETHIDLDRPPGAGGVVPEMIFTHAFITPIRIRGIFLLLDGNVTAS